MVIDEAAYHFPQRCPRTACDVGSCTPAQHKNKPVEEARIPVRAEFGVSDGYSPARPHVVYHDLQCALIIGDDAYSQCI